MPTYTTFEELEIWQEARKLLKSVREICNRPRVKRDFSFTDQITRSTRSISHNIAEGFECMTTPEFINFLGIAKRSTGETRSHFYDALDELYITKEEFQLLTDHTKRIGRMIAGFIHYLQTVDQKKKRTLKNPINNQQSKISNPITSSL